MSRSFVAKQESPQINPELKTDLERHVLNSHRVRYEDGFKGCAECGRAFPCEQARALVEIEALLSLIRSLNIAPPAQI